MKCFDICVIAVSDSPFRRRTLRRSVNRNSELQIKRPSHTTSSPFNQLESSRQDVRTVTYPPAGSAASRRSPYLDKISITTLANNLLNQSISNSIAVSTTPRSSLLAMPPIPRLHVLLPAVKSRRQGVPSHRRTYLHPRYVTPHLSNARFGIALLIQISGLVHRGRRGHGVLLSV